LRRHVSVRPAFNHEHTGAATASAASPQIKYQPSPNEEEVEIDFTPPFKRISMCSGLEEVLNCKLPALDDPAADDALRALLKKHEVELTPPHTTARMLDALVGEFLEGEAARRLRRRLKREAQRVCARVHV
jgi:lysyl-tRNA synthetase, class II